MISIWIVGSIDLAEFNKAWKQLKETVKLHKDRIVIKLFRIEDLEKLGETVGIQSLMEILTDTKTLKLTHGVIVFEIEGVKVHYYPVSIWPQEGIVIDADSSYRMAYSQQFTLKQLRSDQDKQKFLVQQLTPTSNYIEAYQNCVNKWWKNFGYKYFYQEVELFKKWRLSL